VLARWEEGRCKAPPAFHIVPISFSRQSDFGVRQADDGARFALEMPVQIGAIGKMGGKNLYCDIAVESRVSGAVNLTHSTRTNSRKDFMWSEFGPYGK